MLVSPYYSINPSDPDVHHKHSDCLSGKQIPATTSAPERTITPCVSTAGTSNTTWVVAQGRLPPAW